MYQNSTKPNHVGNYSFREVEESDQIPTGYEVQVLAEMKQKKRSCVVQLPPLPPSRAPDDKREK